MLAKSPQVNSMRGLPVRLPLSSCSLTFTGRLTWVFIANVFLINSPLEFHGISFQHKIN